MVAQQILSILSALAANSERFVFEGREIDLVWSCGIFITMNPGMCGGRWGGGGGGRRDGGQGEGGMCLLAHVCVCVWVGGWVSGRGEEEDVSMCV